MMMSYDINNKLKLIEIDLLDNFIKVCKKYDLKYYVIGGTLLGTVRHKGFIPWDDDIDVAMPRNDYIRFEKIAAKELPNYIFFQTRNSDPEYYLTMGKLRNSNTTFVETSVKNLNINHGIFIDVFPLDYYPENIIKQSLIDFNNLLLRFRFKKEMPIEAYKKKNVIGRTIDYIFSNIMTLFLPTVDLAYKYRYMLHRSCKNSRLWANYGGAWGKKEIVPKQWYGKGKEMQFENIKVNVPEKYDLWLRRVYRNYMELPPVEKRVTHHYTEIIDVEHSYKEKWNPKL